MSAELLSQYKALVGVRLNMIVDESLRFSGNDNSSRSISNSDDKALLTHLRSISDLVITDSATANAEGYRQSKLVAIEVWSRSGSFRGMDALAQDASKKPIRFCKIDDVALALRARASDAKMILLETGPTLSREIAMSNLIDEVCLTISQVANPQAAMEICQEFMTLIGIDGFASEHMIEYRGSTYVRLSRSNGVA
jgi:riboflavin biosynthesis pyrimidine reductase